MKEWRRVSIKSICTGVYDAPHATPKPSDNGAIFLGIKNITEDGKLDLSNIRYISEDDFIKWTKRVLPRAGDIVFSYEATLHRYAIIPEGFRGCLGRRLALIRTNDLKVNHRFLFYYFFSEDWHITINQNLLFGSTVNRIPVGKFPDFQIYLPSLKTQNKIAFILSAYDDLIENNTRRIKVLETMAQTLYQEWFVKFRFPGHEQVNMLESELGLIPEGWLGKLEDALILQRGFDLPIKKRKQGNVPVYASTGITGTHNEAKIKAPGVVTGRSGSLGTVMYVDEDFWALNTTLWVREFRKVTPIYAFYLLSSLGLEQYNSGAAVPSLNRNNVHGLPVVIPNSSILEQFNNYVEPLFKLKKSLQQKNDNLRKTRDLLLPKLISGQIDVENLDINTGELAA